MNKPKREDAPLRTHCTACRVVFEKPQRSGYCGTCSRERSRQWRETHKAPPCEKKAPAVRMHCSDCNAPFEEPRQSPYCPACASRRTREWAERNPEKAAALRARFAIKTSCAVCHEEMSPRKSTRCQRCDRVYRQGRRDEERRIHAAATKRAKEKNPEVFKARVKAWRKANPGRHAASKVRNYAKRKGAPGSHTYAEWLRVLETAGYKCAYCGCPLTEKTATRDHIVALTKGGSNDASNLTPACARCNSAKNNRSVAEFHEHRRRQHS